MYNPFAKRIQKAVETAIVSHLVEVAGGKGLNVTTAVLSALRRRPTSHVLAEQLPKRGMWVVYLGEVYILTNLEPGDVATIHKILPDGTSLTDATGKTAEFHVLANMLTQATFEDIPVSRRPDKDVAARFGYT